jgi:transcriptional regulator
MKSMYLPHLFREENTETLVEFMRANSFATLVSIVDGAPFATHLPLVVHWQDDVITLSGHLARPNAQWQAFDQGESLAIFTGPHAYISPSLYEKRESVPTWNYIAVHAYGRPTLLDLVDARPQVEAMIDSLIENNDPAYREQWQELPEKFREGMLKGIVAFEMRVTRLEGKYKLSQNRSLVDRQNVAQALLQSPNPVIYGVGEAMSRELDAPS